MLSIKNLVKTYNVKNGAEVRALDDVTVSFPETGLVFLLGKSGSGKSTLLNLAGGLDAPTEGEIVVMGKSSKDFTNSDFDSYRNTYVGFVFQEYNVLEEFTVEENVALALELQGKTKSRDKVMQILKEVELADMARRKPNTLSGGQKQRVAIARALVKDPQIIMADEPTGALDSTTGKQVFDILKKLSQTRLVLVVSHDREFAESYADRIIELKDGKIISDVSKVKDGDAFEAREVVLSEDVYTKIRTFLETNSNENKSYRNFLQVSELGGKSFETTPPQTEKEYDGNEIKFIRSRMPLGKAIKMGASGLKLKPFRLFFTIFLSVISFVLFGLLSTMTFYDNDRVLAESLKQSDFEYVMMEKNYVTRNYNYDDTRYENTTRVPITPADVAAHSEGALGAYQIYVAGQSNIQPSSSNYYQLSIRYVATASENHPFRGTGFEGKYPKGADEIAVSSYFLEVVKHSTFTRLKEDGSFGTKKIINQASDLIGERVFISSLEATFTVTGVFDSGAIPERFERLKIYSPEKSYQQLLAAYTSYLPDSVHSLVLVSNAFYSEFGSVVGYHYYGSGANYFHSCNNRYDFNVTRSGDAKETKDLFNGGEGYMQPYSSDPAARQYPVTFFGEPKEALGEREFILPLNAVADYYAFLAEDKTDGADEAYTAFDAACNAVIYGRLTDSEEIEEKKKVINDYIAAHPMEPLTLVENGRQKGTATVVGLYYGNDIHLDGFYCSQAFYEEAQPSNTPREETNYRPEPFAVYDYILCPLDRSDAAIQAFAKLLGAKNANPENDVFYTLDNHVYESVEIANSLIELLSTVFLWTGIVFTVFAALLLFNFISVSITNKKKEIGILRAVGARGLDVFKIFFSESGIIVGICTVLALVGTILLTSFLNSLLRVEVGLEVALFVFGPFSVALMLAVSVVVAFVSTFLPVYFTAKKKPVESIRAL